MLPTAGHLEEYRRELIDTYAPYEDADDLVDTHFENQLFSYYVECASDNAINNDQRSYNIFLSTASLTVSVLLAFFAIIPSLAEDYFHEGDLHDKTEATAATTPATFAECEGIYAEAPSSFDTNNNADKTAVNATE